MAVSKSLDVNGKSVTITVDDPEMPLLYALRDNLALEGSLGWFAGSGTDAISRFADSDFVYLRLKYFF